MNIQNNVCLHKCFVIGLSDEHGNITKFLKSFDLFSIVYKHVSVFTTFEAAKDAAIDMANNKGMPTGLSLNVLEVHSTVEIPTSIAYANIADFS